MFDIQLYPDPAALLPKTIAAIQHFGIVQSLYVDVFHNELTVTALHGESGNLTKVLALLRIPANLSIVGEVYLDLGRDRPNGLKINLRLLLRHLAIAVLGELLFIKKESEIADRLVLEAADLEFQLLRDSEMLLEEDNDGWFFLKERRYEYRAIIGIPAEKLIEVIIHLHHFGDSGCGKSRMCYWRDQACTSNLLCLHAERASCHHQHV